MAKFRRKSSIAAVYCLFGLSLFIALTATVSIKLSAKAQTSTAISIGTSVVQFPNSTGDATRPIRVWCYKPRNYTATSSIVFVMHGVHRDADRYCREWAPYAEQSSFLLVCPEFDLARFSTSQYPLGNILDENKQSVPRSQWTYSTIENLFDWIKQQSGNRSPRYYLFGHSAGAQFVHRFVIFMPDARYQRAIAANAGYYLMPTFADHRFPYGLRDSSISQADVLRSFGRDFVIMLGEEDVDTTDPDLNQSAHAEEQGPNRLERGQKFYATARAVASELGAPLNWQIQTVPGAHHKDSQIIAPAVARLLAR